MHGPGSTVAQGGAAGQIPGLKCMSSISRCFSHEGGWLYDPTCWTGCCRESQKVLSVEAWPLWLQCARVGK